MAYCTYVDVQSKFKAVIFGAAAAVTQTEATAEITRAEAHVIGEISPYYDTTKITQTKTPIAWEIIRQICILYAAGMISNILKRNGIEYPDATAVASGQGMLSQAKAMLKGIALYAAYGNVPGAINLVDATPYQTSGGGAFSGQRASEPIIKKDCEQW